MSKLKTVVLGGGFAGTSAVKRLVALRSLLSQELEITLVDKRDNFEFLPSLPDIVGGWLRPETLRVDLSKFCRKHGCRFVKNEIVSVDFEKKRLHARGENIPYDYLVLSSGTRTSFFGMESAEKNCLALDSVADAIRVRDAMLRAGTAKGQLNVAVVGGGYTGLEMAANARYLLNRYNIVHKISIVERAPAILPMLPDWIRNEAREELSRTGIEIITEDSFKDYEDGNIILESGGKIEDAVCLWSAGVKTPGCIQDSAAEKEKSRLKVDSYLRVNENVFAAGNTAAFREEGADDLLRLAVMFSLAQGKVAAQNVVNAILNKPLVEYKPLDLGYLIPLASGKAPGIVLGRKVHGRSGYFLHYFMCVYRSWWPNNVKLLRDFLINRHLLKQRGG